MIAGHEMGDLGQNPPTASTRICQNPLLPEIFHAHLHYQLVAVVEQLKNVKL